MGRKTLLAVIALIGVMPIRASAFDSVDVLSGYAYADLKFQPEVYRLNPLYVSLNENMSDPGKERLFQFCVEPFYSRVFSPDSNYEAGADFAFKLGLWNHPGPVLPYIKAGIGGIYVSQHTVAQHADWNFNEYFGAGMLFFAHGPLSAVAEARIRHISNGSFAEPNAGINTYLFLAGLSWNF